MRAPRKGFRGILQRLTLSDADLESMELAHQSLESGCSTLNRCGERSRVVLQGRLSVVSVNPRGTRKWLEAELDDGTGTVTLIWMGRRSIPGITAGKTLRVQGRLGDERGRKVMFNPQYEILG